MKHCLAWAFVLLVWPLAVAAQPIDLRVNRDAAVQDYDFTWVHWFETHGREYVREAVGQRPLPWDTPASRRWRGEVIGALMPMLDDADEGVRAAAVLALGRIGHEGVLDRVLPGFAAQDKVSLLLDASPDVRLAAWVSLGLLETDRARAALAAEPLADAGEADRAAQAAAIGLMTTLDRSHATWLLARLDDPDESLEVKRWCVWAMTRHDEASLDAAFDAVLLNLPSTFLISEVLSNRGYVQRKGGAKWLVDVLRYHPDMREWAGYRALSLMPAEGLYGSTPRRLAMETRIAAALTLADQPWIEDDEDRRFVLSHLRRRMVSGNADQVMDFNRGFDTLAYFMHCEGDQDDRDLLYDQLRGFTELRADDPGVLAGLEEDQTPTRDDLFVRQSDNELRGYAAIAAGLLMRRGTEGTALYRERPLRVDRAIEVERLKRRFGIRLMRAVADPGETMSYRAACALALGLSGDDRYKTELAVELGKLQAGDEAVLGYGLLALAMLGEDRAAVPARRYLTRPGPVSGAGDQLGRRAALSALGVIGDKAGDEVKRALVGAWGRNVWVSRHVAEAAAWAGRYEAVPAMLNALQNDSANWRQAAAASLGRVFDASFPSRLSALIQRSNPTLTLRPLTDEQAAQDDAAASGWPMGRLHAIGDRFVVEVMRQPSPTPVPGNDQEAR